MNVLYTAEATATGGRDGHSKTSDGKVDVALSIPKELGGDSGPGTNPEQLFATGYSACFLGALRFVAGQAKTRIAPDATVNAHVGIGKRDDGGGFGLEIELKIHVPELDQETVEKLVAQADIVCPYSHSIRGNVPVKLTVI
jgi:osmotically inducible protein OsmC